jgi:hypothetical protein
MNHIASLNYLVQSLFIGRCSNVADNIQKRREGGRKT